MFEVIKQNVVYPLAGRLGTAAAAALIGMGASDQHANWVALGVAGGVGVAIDLLSSWLRRRFVVNTTFTQVIDGLFPEPDDSTLTPVGKAARALEVKQFLKEYDYRGVGGGQ